MPSTGWYVLGLTISIGAIGMFAAYSMSREIKRNYPDLYHEIGPPVFSTDLSKEQWPFLRFILTRKYASIGSRKIRLLGDIVWLCNVSVWLSFVYQALFHANDFHIPF